MKFPWWRLPKVRKKRERVKRARHNRILAAAERRLDELRLKPHPGAKLGLLKRLDARVFEELILLALHRQGHQVTRNPSYSNDGGIDGRATINGTAYVIQAKRYRDYIKLDDVREFIALCDAQQRLGLFVHTGKTPAPCWQLARNSRVEIVSGNKLLAFLAPTRARR